MTKYGEMIREHTRLYLERCGLSHVEAQIYAKRDAERQEAFAEAHNACATELLALIRGKPDNGCATTCMKCGRQVPDLGPLKTLYVCEKCNANKAKPTDTKNNAEWF